MEFVIPAQYIQKAISHILLYEPNAPFWTVDNEIRCGTYESFEKMNDLEKKDLINIGWDFDYFSGFWYFKLK